jgi:hypothetical protein
MPWSCSIVQSHRDAKQAGHMWQEKDGHWLVLLPNGAIHDIQGLSKEGQPWTITGEAPNFTVSPSINHESGWHGWLQNGILTG